MVFIALIPVVIYASLRPLFCHGYAHFLEIYQLLPTVGVLPKPDGHWDDLSLYLLFLEENISELKSHKYIKVKPSHVPCIQYGISMYLHILLYFLSDTGY